jgi:salicylate hydroxylase
MAVKGREITVLGAGVAGLAVARALALRGARVRVLEQAGELTDIGAGLQITPNGAAVLRALGLGDGLAAIGLRSEGIELRNGLDGGLVTRLDLGRLRPGQDYRLLHRADLIGLLAEGAREAGVEISLMQRIDSVRFDPEGPVLQTAQRVQIRPGLLIGADGLQSVVRQQLDGVIAPFFTHQVAWRAVIPAEPGARPVAEVFMAPGKHLVSYPLRGGSLRNIVAVEERRIWVEEGWSLRDDDMEVRLAFADFAPRVRGWLEQIEACWLWGLFRHPVAQNWGWAAPSAPDLGVAILGDAAHPTLPFLAQGANMALEDAWVLANALEQHSELAQALSAYRAARATRCARIVEAANGNARNYHLGGLRQSLAHLGLRTIGTAAPDLLLRRYDWIYGHDVTAGGTG